MGLDDVLICAGEHSNMVEVYNALDIASSSGEGLRSALRGDRYVGSAMVVGYVGWFGQMIVRHCARSGVRFFCLREWSFVSRLVRLGIISCHNLASTSYSS